jgi:hypothetical protein
MVAHRRPAVESAGPAAQVLIRPAVDPAHRTAVLVRNRTPAFLEPLHRPSSADGTAFVVVWLAGPFVIG